jgi:hypothetical protein
MTKAADAVTGAIVATKGAVELSGWGVNRSWADGGEDPCEDIWVHESDEETPHWHYVTSGLSDPSKVPTKVPTTPGAERSGLGYELTFRLKRQPGDTEAPQWPWARLQELGWGIFKAGMKLAPGHYMRRRAVITGGNPPTELQGYYLIADPRLPAASSDSGRIDFLQVVGITDEELLQCESGEPDEVEAQLRARSPLGITDLERTGPETEEVDLLQLSALQAALGRHCLEALPADASRLVFTTTASLPDQQFTHDVEDEATFDLDRRGDALMKRIFALHWNAGSDLISARVTLAKKPDGSWSSAFDFAYDDDDAAVETA